MISRLQSQYCTTRKKKIFSIKVCYNNVPIENVSSSKYLGFLSLILDQNLLLTEEINVNKTKVSRATGIITKIKRFLSEKTLVSFYHSLLHLHLFTE